MYPSSSSSSSSSSQSMAQAQVQVQAQAGAGLTRYGSAPGSLLTSTVDAVIGGSRPSPSPYYSGDSSESTCKEQRSSYAFGSALLRQKSSPAGFLSATTTHNPNGPGFTITRVGHSHSHSHSRLNSQLSFTPHSQDSQNTNNVNVMVADPTATTTTSTCFPVDAWDNSIAFSSPPTKRSKNTNDPDILHSLNAFDSHFTLPHTSLDIDNLLHIPQDSVPCKIRAKRGCATHPRSIAERERRTRISGKLKKLQDLVPNMDKQTSYADMLDLAVQHIKGLQTQLQKLHKELENCSCGCKQSK